MTTKTRKPRTPTPYKFTIDENLFKNIIKLHFGVTDADNVDTNADQYLVTQLSVNDNDCLTKINCDQYENVEIIEGDMTPKYNYYDQSLISNNLVNSSNSVITIPEKRVVYFLDSKKNKIKLWPTMIDITNDIILPLYTNNPCRFCHRTYTTNPLGCPIKYYPHSSNNESKIKQIETFLNKHNLSSKSTDYFETEQMFCRLSCVKSYIYDCISKNPMSYKYCNSLSYLTLMFKKINDIQGIPQNIPLSPPIEVLESYGGHLSIDAYHKSIETVQYEVTINVKKPIMFSASTYIEEIGIKV